MWKCGNVEMWKCGKVERWKYPPFHTHTYLSKYGRVRVHYLDECLAYSGSHPERFACHLLSLSGVNLVPHHTRALPSDPSAPRSTWPLHVFLSEYYLYSFAYILPGASVFSRIFSNIENIFVTRQVDGGQKSLQMYGCLPKTA